MATYNGGKYNDWYVGTEAADSAYGNAGDDRIETRGGNDRLYGGSGIDQLYAGIGDDLLDGGTGADYLDGDDGNDTYVVDHVDDRIVERSGNDTIQAAFHYVLAAELENLTLTGTAALGGFGNDFANLITGNGAANRLDGGLGDDTLTGGAGADSFVFSTALNVGPNFDRITDFSAADDSILLDRSVFTGLGANGALAGSAFVNGATAADGDDRILYDRATGNIFYDADGSGGGVKILFARVTAGAALTSADFVATGGTAGTLYTGDAADNLFSGSGGDDQASGHGGNDLLVGGGGNDRFAGGDGTDRIHGGDGGDHLDGGTGSDYLHGGRGDDTYVVDFESVDSRYPTDRVVEAANEGVDTVLSSLGSYALTSFVEHLTLTGTAYQGIGNALDNVITGTAANNRLSGERGADRLIGSAGDDFYWVDNAGDAVVELAGEGVDTVQSSVTHRLADHVENLSLVFQDSPYGAIRDFDGYGNALANRITGSVYNNLIDGGLGNDTLTGGAGADRFLFSAALHAETNTDLITDFSVGYDTIVLDRAVFTAIGAEGPLSASAFVNGVTALDADDRILYAKDVGYIFYDADGSGAGAKVLFAKVNAGTALSNVHFSAVGGEPPVDGGTRPTYVGDAGDNIFAGGGEADEAEGNGGNDRLQGNGGDDILDGGAANDTLEGGLGADTLRGGDGSDRLSSSVTPNTYGDGWQPASPDTGAEADAVFGGAGDDQIFAGYGDSVDGGADTDRLYISFQGATAGVQADFRKLYSGGSMTIGGATIAGIEAVIHVEGSNFDDFIAGTSGEFNGTIYGRGGNDHILAAFSSGLIYGGDGDDLIDSSATVTSYSHYGEAGNDRLIGGELTNKLYGGEGNDFLDGGRQADYLFGGAGDDIYVVDVGGSHPEDAVRDQVSEAAGEGTDTVLASATYWLAANVENLTLTGVAAISAHGNGLDNVLTGNAAANRMYGAGGADRMSGGAGDDDYQVENAGDVVVEAAGEGIDTVQSEISYTLADNVETLLLVGTRTSMGTYVDQAIDGTGNALNNRLYGNSASNILDGGAGADLVVGGGGNDRLAGGAGDDRLEGGDGNDIYTVASADDLLVELAGQGSDTARASISYTLGDNVEHLALLGRAAIDGTGNRLNNRLTGNVGDNRLDGGAANDVLAGGLGNDILIGGDGADRLTGGAGQDLLSGGLGADTFLFVEEADSPVAAADAIADFAQGLDKIDLTGIDADALAAGDQAFTFIGTEAFAGGGAAGAGQLRFEQVDGRTLVSGDVDGDGAADFLIRLDSPLPLQATDFLL